MNKLWIIGVFVVAASAWSSTRHDLETVTYVDLIKATNKAKMVRECRDKHWPTTQHCAEVALGMIQALEEE